MVFSEGNYKNASSLAYGGRRVISCGMRYCGLDIYQGQEEQPDRKKDLILFCSLVQLFRNFPDRAQILEGQVESSPIDPKD